MANFYQTGLISTLQRLRDFDANRDRRRLVRFGNTNKIALVLPALYSELERPALAPILDVLVTVPYIHEIVIALDRATPERAADLVRTEVQLLAQEEEAGG